VAGGHGPLILEQAADLVYEAGPRVAASWAPARAAVLACWSETPTVSRSLRALVSELTLAGLEVLLVRAVDEPTPLDWGPEGLPVGVSVVRRPNVGYDFGSWCAALAGFPGLAGAERLLLVNDSFLGPFGSLRTILGHFDEVPVDVWGLASSAQIGFHLQSHMIGYRNGVLADSGPQRFWRGIRVQPSKPEMIAAYEVGQTTMLRAESYSILAEFPYQWIDPVGCNVTIEGWDQLLDRGFPFVKRELLKEPFIQTGIMRIERDAVLARAARQFGVDLNDWT
jgi:hypothetical protein